MFFASNSPFCPRCGAAHCQPAGASNSWACQQCGAQFTLQYGYAPLQAQGSAWWPHLRWVLPLVVILLMLPWLLPLLRKEMQALPAQRAVEEARNLGRVEAGNVVLRDGQRVLLRLYETRENGQTVSQVVLTDAASGKRLAEPQRLATPGTGGGAQTKLEYFSDGQLYLALKERSLLRLDPATLRFVDLLPELTQRHAAQLGEGLVKLEMQSRDRPDSLLVTTRSGTQYYVYWLAGQIVPYGDASKAYAQAVQSYGQQRAQYRFIEMPREAGQETASYLVRFWARYEPGQPYYNGYFSLHPAGSKEVREAQPGSYLDVGGGLMTRHWYVKEQGLLKVQVVQPQSLRFHAEVMGESPTRVLLAYNPTPLRNEGRVIQLLDKSNNQVAWSRPADQLPQLGQREGGAYVTGQVVPGGFLLFNDMREPALLLDDNGQILQDFVSPRGEAR